MDAVIRKILEAAVYAPSGDNSQPWRFEVAGNTVKVLNIRERDRTLYNFKYRGSFVAHGALLENILIASSFFGYKAVLDFLPDPQHIHWVATVFLEKADVKSDPLYPYITKRVTNRRFYKKEKLIPEQKDRILNSAGPIGYGRVILIEDSSQKESLATALAVNDRLILENRHIHDFIFEQINWTEKEELEKRSGLYVKTLELPVPKEFMFRLFRHWSVVRVFNKVGFARLIAKDGAKLYSSSPALGFILVPGDSYLDFINTGRVLERLWLEATRTGLSLQPLGGLVYLAQRVAAGDTAAFSAGEVNLIKNAYSRIRNILGIKEEIVSLAFRIGRGGSPTARSCRMPPEIVKK